MAMSFQDFFYKYESSLKQLDKGFIVLLGGGNKCKVCITPFLGRSKMRVHYFEFGEYVTGGLYYPEEFFIGYDVCRAEVRHRSLREAMLHVITAA